MFAVLDFASQYSQLIVRRLRDLGYYAELYPYNVPLSTLQALSPKGIILSGGPFSLQEKQAPQRDVDPLHDLAPLLGICYGMQMIAHQKGGHMVAGTHREYGLNTIYWEKPFWEGAETFKGSEKPKNLQNTKHPKHPKNSQDLPNLQNPQGSQDLQDSKNPLNPKAPQIPKGLKSLKSLKIPKEQKVWMSHGDTLKKLPSEVQLCARSQDGHCAAFWGERLLAFQFHPEVTHTEKGAELLNYFAQTLCGSSPQWSKENIFERAKKQLFQQLQPLKQRQTQGDSKKKKILCALSGGVDSSVLALFLSQVLGPEQLHCVFVDTGLLREGEFEEVLGAYKALGLKVKGIDGKATFLQALKGVVDPEKKRKIIGRIFIELFERESQRKNRAEGQKTNQKESQKEIQKGNPKGKQSHQPDDPANMANPTDTDTTDTDTTKMKHKDTTKATHPTDTDTDTDTANLVDIGYLAQGTLYPDVIESHSPNALSKVTIKSHHNVGGLPPQMPWKLIEPFCRLFKDEVRQLGEHLHLPPHLLHRHPFPGPGLAVRILGEVTEEKLRILRQCDKLFIQALKDHQAYSKIWQALCVLLPISSVGVQGDGRSYGNVLALRCVVSTDGMTADWYPFSLKLLQFISNLITNKVPEINRVVYDITSKPPATIEWE